MVRRLVSLGADFIKVMASGGGTPGSLPQHPSFTVEELTVIVETAHDLGRKVAMHCIATESIDRAVTAGTDLIEHAMFYGLDIVPRIDEAVADRLADSQIPVTPTHAGRPGPARATRPGGRPGGLGAAADHRTGDRGPPAGAGRADAGRVRRRLARHSLRHLLEGASRAGRGRHDACRSHRGRHQRTGQARWVWIRSGALRPGYRADLLVVEGNVATDIRCLERVKAVFQGGQQVVPIGPLPVA